jgi:hypothetical protein
LLQPLSSGRLDEIKYTAEIRAVVNQLTHEIKRYSVIVVDTSNLIQIFKENANEYYQEINFECRCGVSLS